MKKFIMNVISVIMAVALVLVPLSTTPAKAANDAAVVARFTYSGQVYEYDTLSQAIADASTVGNLTVYLVSNYTLPADLEIPSNVTVTIPTSADYNDTVTGVNNVSGNGTSGSPNVTLTIPVGLTLDVKGTLLVAGNQQSTQPRSGFLTGSYGAIDLQGSIVVETGGKLYARGEIMSTGETTGTVTAKSGSSVYERFQIADWRGGTASQNAYEDDNIFPFSLFELGGITANSVFMNGSNLFGQAFIYAAGQGNDVTVFYLTAEPGSEGETSLLQFTDKTRTDDNITFTHAGDETTLTVNGHVATGDLTFTYQVIIFNYTISSRGLECPFGYHTNIVVANGGTVDVNSKLVFLPGCDVTLEGNGAINVPAGSEINFFGANTYKTDYYLGNAADWNVNAPATLTIGTSANVNVADTGILSSTDPTFGNFFGRKFSETGKTVIVKEAIQATGSTAYTVAEVTFYDGREA